MNLQTHISSDLWGAIASPYEAGNYTHAVLEAVHRLTTVLRERSGVDGDGVTLVGQALGGDAPKLRVNALQSESDRNVQRGVEQLLRGIYLAIRNPRSHEQFKDTQQDADAIIHFVDYILRILSASKEAFTVEDFINSLSDSEFVESTRYAELLVAEVPAGRRGDALAAFFDAREVLELRKLRYVISSLLSLLTEAQLAQYVALVSNALRTTAEDLAIRTALQMMTPQLWPRIAEAARLRIENKLLREIKQGAIVSDGKRASKTTGALATWSSSFIKNFTLRTECAGALIAKLESSDGDRRDYIAKYFMSRLPEMLTEEREIRRAIRAISSAIRSGDLNVREAIIANVQEFPVEWQSQLVEALKDLTDQENPALFLNNGAPFLAAPTVSDDDIPF